MPQPPKQFYVQGTETALELLTRLPKDGLAIVGTRNPHPRSCQAVQKWTEPLKKTHLIIISGFAYGIDSAAHTAAIHHQIPTIAVLGTGLNVNYPSGHQTLRKQIVERGGLLVSEFSPDTPANSFHFPRRNRIIAHWSNAVVVVEAPSRSGALKTAQYACDSRQREIQCFAVPCFPGDPKMAGNQILLDTKKAHPFWGPHSLGSVWIPLSTLSPASDTRLQSPIRTKIWDHIQISSPPGISFHELFNWASAQGWPPETVEPLLSDLLRERQIHLAFGMLSI